MYWVTRKMNPYRAKNEIVTEALAAEKAGTLNRLTSIVGSASCAARRAPKTAAATAVAANPARLAADSQPRLGASMMV